MIYVYLDAIAVGIAYAEYQNDKLNNDLKKRFKTMSTNDHGDGHRCIFSLQKCTALEYQKRWVYHITL